jgi:hypothetical protein
MMKDLRAAGKDTGHSPAQTDDRIFDAVADIPGCAAR